MKLQSVPRWLVLVALLLACAVLSLFLNARRPPREPAPIVPILVMAPSYKIPPEPVSLFDRLIPPRRGWAWLLHLKELVTGRRKMVALGAEVIAFADWPGGGTPGTLSRKPDLVQTNGVEIWLLGSAELKALQTQRPVGSEVLFMPRVETSDGIQSELFTGSAFSLPLSTANAGFLIDLLPHVRKNSIDLIALASLTEARTNQPASAASVGTVSIWTNLAVAVRVQLTNGGSVFILDGPRGADPKRTGLVITAGLPLARK